MTSITLTNVPPELTQRLQHRAQQNDRTVEAEITEILTRALATEPMPKDPAPPQSGPSHPGLGTAIRQLFAEVGGVELPEIPREPIRQPPTF